MLEFYPKKSSSKRVQKKQLSCYMEGDMNCEDINGGNTEPREGLCDELQRT